ncbi:MAG: SCO family protein [Sphingomicrobium sp.]
MKLRKIQLILWILVGLALIAGMAVMMSQRSSLPPSPAEVKVGGPFTLTAADGSKFSSDRLAGRPHAIFFGFIHCPDVCPTTLARLAKLRNELGKGHEAFDIVFVSVDPERDTAEEMARYVKLFATPVIALTGSPADIDTVKNSFGIYSEKVPEKDGAYSVDHSAQVLLFNRDGSFGGTIAFDENDSAALKKLENISDS